MGLANIPRRQYAVEMLTPQFLITGTLEPFGPLMIFLKDPNRMAIPIKGAEISALDGEITVARLKAEEMHVRKEEIICIRPVNDLTPNTAQLLPRRETLRVFTDRFAVQATFACGTDTRVPELFDMYPGQWVIGVDTHVHPLTPIRVPVFHDSKFLLINKVHIRFYQHLPPPAAQPPHPPEQPHPA